MEKITINDDIPVIALKAPFFPEGIPDAYDKLHSILGKSAPRRVFGLSRPEKDSEIIYWAAAEELEAGEAEQLECESLVIKKGTYVSITVENYKQDIPAIRRAFEQLLTESNLDPDGYCVEWYDADAAGYGSASESVKCMIRMDD
jgi:predicted transcriptional regulator YdeE